MARRKDLLTRANCIAGFKVGRDFSTWIKDRINKYDFVEDLDFFTSIPQFGDGKVSPNKPKIKDPKTGRVVAKDYIISVDMAKESAMVEEIYD